MCSLSGSTAACLTVAQEVAMQAEQEVSYKSCAPANTFACQPGTGEVVTQPLVPLQQFLSPHRLATKSVDGRMNVWDVEEKKQMSTWKVSILLHQPQAAFCINISKALVIRFF